MTSEISSITKRLEGKGTGILLIKYKEDLVCNALAVAWNAVMLLALKVEDNVLHIMIVPAIAPQLDALSNSLAKLPCTFFKVLHALIIKYVCMALQLRAAKPQSELVEVYT